MIHPTNSTTNPIRHNHRRSVGVFPNRHAAEQALYELRDSGFPMDRVSVVTREGGRTDEIAGAEVSDRVGNKADEGATVGALSGGALGGLTGLLVGLGTLAIPGVGPIMLAGATATALATTLAGGAIGAVTGGLLGALIGLGIPEDRARVYHDRIAQGGYLVIVDGTDAEIARAETILHRRGIEDYGVYAAPEHSSATDPTIATTPVAPVATAPTYSTSADTPAGAAFGKCYAVGFFPHLHDAEHAITDLRSIGFPLSQVSLVAENFQRRVHLPGIDLRDRFEAMRLGIPTEQAHFYNDRITRGEYMVIVEGTADEIDRAASILTRCGIQEWRIYDPTAISSTAATSATPSDLTVSSNYDQQAVGFFADQGAAEQAIADLRNAGFSLSQIALVAQGATQRKSVSGVTLLDRLDNTRFGFPDERVRFFHNRLAQGGYLLIVQGSAEQLRQAEIILHRRGIQEWGVYTATHVSRTDRSVDSTERYTAPDSEPSDRTPRVESVSPHVTIIDRRDETRL